MSADQVKTFFGGILRASATQLLNSVTNSAVHQYSSADQRHVVQDVSGNQDDIARYAINKRNDSLVLHGPIEAAAFVSRQAKWNMLIHQHGSERVFSIYRSDDEQDALYTFNLYETALPALAKLDPTVCEKNTLEKLCQKLREQDNQGWTPAHLAAAFDYYKVLRVPSVKKFLNLQEGRNLETPLHVAIKHKSFGSVNELLNLGAQCDITDLRGNTVLHYAAVSTTQILALLIEKIPERLAPLMDAVNQENLTPLHVSCKNNNSENVKVLLKAGANPNINSPNDGFPIHIAVKNKCAVSIQEIISHSASQLNAKDPKSGGTPLHWASGPEALGVLLELGCDPNMGNNSGDSPLHIAARRGCLKSTLQLLCHKAFPDLKNGEGDTPLHVASRLCSRLIIQALIAFGADINLLNNSNESGRHLICTSQRSDKDYILFYLVAVGANRCTASLENRCPDGCKSSGTFMGIPPENYAQTFPTDLVNEALYAFSVSHEVRSKSRRGSMDLRTDGEAAGTGRGSPHNLLGSYIGGRVLCLDGGGIRGVILTQTLLYMEKVFGVQIVDLFDWIAGTSTGGILALCLASGKCVADIQTLYMRFKDKVFTGERPYSSEVLEEFLKNELGSDTKMSQIRRPRVMITTAIVDHRPAEFHFFRNYLSPAVLLGQTDACQRSPDDVYVWEAAKATGAAPSYFRLGGKYVDGGLVANNPTLDALTELTQFSSVMKAIGDSREVEHKLPTVVVSIGTGIQPRVPANITHYDISRPSGIIDAITKVPKLASVIALLVEQATQTEGQVVERSKAWCSSIGVPFFRFSPALSSYIDLDDTNDETLINLMWETNAYLYAHHASIVELKHHLFQNGSPPAEIN